MAQFAGKNSSSSTGVGGRKRTTQDSKVAFDGKGANFQRRDYYGRRRRRDLTIEGAAELVYPLQNAGNTFSHGPFIKLEGLVKDPRITPIHLKLINKIHIKNI